MDKKAIHMVRGQGLMGVSTRVIGPNEAQASLKIGDLHSKILEKRQNVILQKKNVPQPLQSM